MEIEEQRVGDITVLSLKGKMTLGEGDILLKDKLNFLVNQGHKAFVLNLADMPYIDSAGNGEMVQSVITVSRQGGTIKFCNLTKRIADLWAITKLLAVFEIYESETDAVASFGLAKFDVSCPLCRPARWTGYLGERFLLSCIECDARFSPRITPGMLAPLEQAGSADTSRVVTADVTDVWWFTYYENGYGQEGVHLTLGWPNTVAITGRLDLFALDIVQMAWDTVPRPRRVVFDTTHVRLASPAGLARLDQLCVSTDGSRAVIFNQPADRECAIAALGSLENTPQSINVSIRRRA